jgi:hypothetical protein
MGHFAFQERREAKRILPGIAKSLKKSIKSLKKSTPSMNLGLRDPEWCRDRVLDWCEEIYCDL